MTKVEKFYLRTPRGEFPINAIYDSKEEAREDGWGYWFTTDDGEYDVLGRDNRVGAVVKNK